ncbi:hypothetical protein K8Q93_01945 [Candidatus Parcubacteria bacterium]|nr:hypothetical protein [Candidatus Parcubacteria bacterium]
MKKRHTAARNAALLSLLLLGMLAGIYFLNPPAHEALSARAAAGPDHYPSQYSDRNITANAVISDPRFRNSIALPRENLLTSVLSSLQRQRSEIGAKPVERGTWLWTPLLDITPEYRESIIKGAKENGIRTIYLSIDSYLDIFAMEEGAEKEIKEQAYDDALQAFIRDAHKAGLSVDAEAGWRNWAERGHEYKAFAVLRYAMEYNRTHEDKLRGFQYDIEPYMLPSYEADKKSVLRNFVSLMNKVVREMEESDLELSVVIPEFYDGGGELTPKFLHGLRYGYTYDHLLNALEQRPGSTIIIMAYRRVALGENGSVDISKDEVSAAAPFQTKVVIAQETGDDLAPHVTFHGTSREYYDEQTGLIEKAFEKEKSYGGLATHYINMFLTLK